MLCVKRCPKENDLNNQLDHGYHFSIVTKLHLSEIPRSFPVFCVLFPDFSSLLKIP